MEAAEALALNNLLIGVYVLRNTARADSLSNFVYRKGRRVGAEDRLRWSVFVDNLKERLLHLKILNNRLHDKISMRHSGRCVSSRL